MSLLGALSGESNYPLEKSTMSNSVGQYKPRTFEETVKDQIVMYQSRIDNLQAVLDSMSPDVKKFVEALQKANL